MLSASLRPLNATEALRGALPEDAYVLSDSPDGVLVIDKEPGSPAAAAGVPLLSVVIGINGGSVAGLNRRGVGAKVAHALREGKLDIRVRHPAPDLGLPPPVTPTWANTPTPTPAAAEGALAEGAVKY